jgi:hypothetical protein
MIKAFKKEKWYGSALAIVLIASVGLFSLTGCAAEKPVDSKSGSITEAPESPEGGSAPETETDTPSAPAISEAPEEDSGDSSSGGESPVPSAAALAEADYFGQWTIDKVLAFGAAGTYSSEDADKMLGKTLSFSADEASIINDQPSDDPIVSGKPDYKETEITADDFLTSYQLTFEKLGIKAESVLEVAVSGPEGSGGCTLLVVDGGTMILAAGGTYFRLVR